ncbi:SDR family NAD(P)-dependent oxidoreductase [Acetobacter suratthaniensis]|uniref:SDR family NAD(P)-dependent oxidoreductase n=1 Tax=Acetobacter suratthaniensis TaxID=1502841 RepID=UPI001FAF2EEB|nr:SDR family NAD(P)-dependent oxidoreductase [Acetobacter suratthaniensis]MCX2564868.1 SDR family NAD(P)-dependent oxidoreductase [Acetobacter suratthaniensis]
MKSDTTAPYAPRVILITGASGGIGAELAHHYAAPGRTLLLWGRNGQKLADLAAQCRSMGASVQTRQVDLCDGQAALNAYRADDAASTPDLVILGAGLSDIQTPDTTTEDPEKVLQLAQVNYSTPVALATAAAQGMAQRGGGRIALFGSVAAFYELPFAASYSSSKSGLAFFAKAAGLGWRQHEIAVTLLAPGFVDTPMSQRLEGPRPFLVSPKKAARLCARAIERKLPVYVFPWPFRVLEVLTRLVPQSLRERILLGLAVGQKDRA